jgi:hypothetical protein
LCEVRWRGAHQALAQTSSVEAHASRGGLADSEPAGDGRRQYVGGPDAPHSLAGHPYASYRHARSAADGAISPVRKASDSDAYHSSSRRVERHSVHLQPRDERSRLDSRPPHFSAFAPVAKGLRPRMCGAIRSSEGSQNALFWLPSKRFIVFRSYRKGLYGGLHFTLALLLLSA